MSTATVPLQIRAAALLADISAHAEDSSTAAVPYRKLFKWLSLVFFLLLSSEIKKLRGSRNATLDHLMDHPSIPNTEPTAIETVIAFVDKRIGLKQLKAKLLNEPVPGGSRWAYVFGSVLLFIFIMQALTGILLMFYYVPTIDHAYASTQYIIHNVDYGWFLLSYHFWGSTAMVVCVFAHMSQVFLWGAYKSPREMIWLVGLALFGIVMGLSFTGYLLPWDQRAYWATTVGVEIMDKTPVVGDFMARFLKGGPTPGQLTLSRFFVIHVMILPAALMGLAGLHLFLFRAAGPAGPFRGSPKEMRAKTDYFFPRQLWKDIVAMAVVFTGICALAFWEPVVLLEEATPDPGDYHPEPEWYFLFLFQLLRLKIFSGEFGQFLGAIAIPGAFMALLVALPFIDKTPERNIFRRPIALTGWIVVMATILLFTVSAIINRQFLE